MDSTGGCNVPCDLGGFIFSVSWSWTWMQEIETNIEADYDKAFAST